MPLRPACLLAPALTFQLPLAKRREPPYMNRRQPPFIVRARRWQSFGDEARTDAATFILSATGEMIMAKTFGATSTTDEVLEGVNLSGKRVLVTGVSAGPGVETARALAAHGAEVVGAARDLAKAKAATVEVRAGAADDGGLELVELNLASLASVRACADALIADGGRFDLVIANAGVMACPFGKTADGFETQFGTNHLGHFVLVNRIAALMKPGSRLVNLSSAGHR